MSESSALASFAELATTLTARANAQRRRRDRLGGCAVIPDYQTLMSPVLRQFLDGNQR